MTLKKRNYILVSCILATTAFFIFITVLFVSAAVKNQITPPENAVRPFNISGEHFLLKQNFICVIASIFCFSFYVPLTLTIIFRLFEKTQVMEIIFFAEFLLGCFMEQFRIFMPMFGLWQTYTSFLNAIGRTVIAGRLLAPLSIFFITVFTDSSQRQDFSSNIFTAILISIFAGLFMPLDPYHTTSTCTVVWSYRGLFLGIRIVLFFATAACFFKKARSKTSDETIAFLIAFLFLSAGYSLLCIADCFLFLIPGILFLIYGTYKFILSYHSMYLWR